VIIIACGASKIARGDRATGKSLGNEGIDLRDGGYVPVEGRVEMNFKFWEKKGKIEEIADATDQLRQQLTKIGEQVTGITAQVAGNGEQAVEVGVQVNKLARIQYKTGQEMLGKLDRLAAGMETVQCWQADHAVDVARLNAVEQQNRYLTEVLIRWLDDIDFACAGLRGQDQERWGQLLEQWGNQLLAALAEIGVHEINLLGRTFNPQWAESISTVARGASAGDREILVPYEVAEVIKRGFVHSDGRLLRKGQVITIREDCTSDQKQ